MSPITLRIQTVQQRINKALADAGRQADELTLLAVSKKQPVEAIQAAIDAGLYQFAESYVNEAIEKIEQIKRSNKKDIEWHFIGPIQSNKTTAIANHFSWVHSLDRIKIAQRLNDQRADNLPPLNVCIQINIDDEQTKSGIHISELDNFVDEISKLPRLKLRGLMALPARNDDLAQQRKPFHRLHGLFAGLQQRDVQLDTLSMGMSYDLEAAILEGASIVRIGTALFGPRPDSQ